MGRLSMPLVPVGAIREFYERLHALHRTADQPSMRDLQRATRTRQRPHGINSTSVHAAFTRPRLARWEVVRDIVRALDGDVAEFAELWQRARQCEVAADVAATTGAHPDGSALTCPDATGQLEAPGFDHSGPAAPPAPADAGLVTDGSTGAQGLADRPIARTGTRREVPRELPPDVRPFVGRADDLGYLDALLPDRESTEPPATTPLAPILLTGTAGVGKTALAVHWAHRVADRFPDGQLYVDLRGYDPDAPLRPTDALAGFLCALGDDPARLPAGLAGRTARYRTLLADRRMLVLLDNAESAAQIRPLLPGSGRCLAVVTSRDSLAGLVARYGAHRRTVGPLPSDAAFELLRSLLPDRVGAEPVAAREVLRHCAGLPLALRVAAERMTARPTAGLTELAGELNQARHPLDALSGGTDPHADLRAAISWSFRALPAPAERFCWQFALHPGHSADSYALAALAGTDLCGTARLVEALLRASLCDQVAPGRYALHHLPRAYGLEQSERPELASRRQAALRRLCDHYLRAGTIATGLLRLAGGGSVLDWWTEPDAPDERSWSDGPIPPLDDAGAARAWLTAERANLAAMARLAMRLGWFREADELAALAPVPDPSRRHDGDPPGQPEPMVPLAS